MNHIVFKFKLSQLYRKLNKEEAAFKELYEMTKREQGTTAAADLLYTRFDRDELEEELYLLITRYLTEKAAKKFIVTPPRNENDDFWMRGNCTGRFHLTNKGITEVRGLLRKDLKERMDIFYPWFAFIIGLIGALTGLIALIKK